MASVCFLPAGCEDSDEDNYYGCYMSKSDYQKSPPKKSELEIFKNNLLSHLQDKSVNKLRVELDKGVSTGFDIDSEVSSNWNLLFHACHDGAQEIVEFLIQERNVNVGIVNSEGLSSLMVACRSNSESELIFRIVRVLLMRDPRLLQKTNGTGETALMFAARSGHAKVVEYLVALGDRLDNVTNFGRNALFYAVEGKQLEVAKMLFEYKIDYSIEDCHGYTAKSLAETNGDTEILELFPPENFTYETPSSYLGYPTIASIIPNTMTTFCETESDGEHIPAYFPDIVSMLKGMDLERFVPLFSKANISLEEFLTLNDGKLAEIGIELPYQRQLILRKIQEFYSEKWSMNSIWFPSHIKSHITSMDLVYILANLLRQVVVLKCHLLHLRSIKAIGKDKIAYDFFTLDHFYEFQGRISELEELLRKLEPVKRELLIPKQNVSKIKWNAVIKWRCDKIKNALKIALPIALLLTTVTVKFLYQSRKL